MKHIALYRKYRPLVLEDVVGQKSITDTIINQINSDKLSHAYLFSGPRGTGKTSVAKIISRVVNCENKTGHNPCNECETCKSILNDSYVDVTEMDAASNRGVDHIRSLIDKTKFPPSAGKYKVIIIDEAHMLTDEAENALLKTLEEPPTYMIFILATTEPNKIQQTIKSRCQRFDFRRLSDEDIVQYLKKVIINESICASDEAVNKIASISAGGMRDALSTLEQVASSEESEITLEILDEIIGSSDLDIYEFVKNILLGDLKQSFACLSAFYDSGKDVKLIISSVIESVRKILIVKSGIELENLNVGLAERTFISNIDRKVTKQRIMHVLEVFLAASSDRNVENKWALIELATAKAITQFVELDKPVDEMIKMLTNRIANLEESLQNVSATFSEMSYKEQVGFEIEAHDNKINKSELINSNKTDLINEKNKIKEGFSDLNLQNKKNQINNDGAFDDFEEVLSGFDFSLDFTEEAIFENEGLVNRNSPVRKSVDIMRRETVALSSNLSQGKDHENLFIDKEVNSRYSEDSSSKKASDLGSETKENQVNKNSSNHSDNWVKVVNYVKSENQALASVVSALSFLEKENSVIKVTYDDPRYKVLKTVFLNGSASTSIEKYAKLVFGDDKIVVEYVD